MLLRLMMMVITTNTIITKRHSVLQCACRCTKHLFIISHLIPLIILGDGYYYSPPFYIEEK